MEETERSQVDELIEFIFSYKVDMYRKLLELVDQQIKKDTLALGQEFQERASQLEAHHRRDDYHEHLVDQYSDASFELEENMGIFLQGFFASSFALFEYELVRVCEWAQKAVKTPFSVKDFGRSASMSDVKRYLSRLGVDFPAGSSEWKQATDYLKIRNKIMHAGSALDEKDDIFPFAKKNGILVEASSFEGNKEFTLQLTRKFCEKALDDMKQVLIQVNVAEEKWSQGEHLRGR